MWNNAELYEANEKEGNSSSPSAEECEYCTGRCINLVCAIQVTLFHLRCRVFAQYCRVDVEANAEAGGVPVINTYLSISGLPLY